MRIRFIFSVTFLLFGLVSFAQTDSSFLRRATISLEKYSSANPTEKVYLHLDKSNYDMGDTVWYKAYTVIGQHHQLSALSGVLYVELISPADTIMSRSILHLNADVAWGGMALPVQAKAGDYYIRAYTNWMRNAGPDYFYHQKVHIGGYVTTPVAQNTPNKLDVQFFPEGGDLVAGLRSKVAVKAVNTNGYGQDIKGAIEDDRGNVVVDFATQHLGMGAFAFSPQPGRTYSARITSGETAFIVPLPPVKSMGYTLGINNSDPDSIFIKVAVNESLFKQKQHSSFYITAQSAGKVYYAARGKLEDMIFTAAVDKKRFPTGIIQFALFSEQGEPLNERSAFVFSNDTLRLHLDVAASPSARGKVKITLNAQNKNQQAVSGTFSVAVVNEGVVADDELSECNILSNLLLTSDLKGYIEQPDYYFIHPSEKTRSDLDILMLTQGYQRFEWKAILNNAPLALAYPPEDALQLAGSVTTPGGKPVPNGKVTLIDTKDQLLLDTLTDSNGNFNFKYLMLPDSAKVILSAKKINNGNNVDIHIKPFDYPPMAIRNNPNGSNQFATDTTSVVTTLTAEKQRRTDFLNRKHQLKGVTIKARYVRKKPDLHNSDNLNGPGNADQVIMADQLKNCAKLTDCLTGLLRASIDPFKAVLVIDGFIIHDTNSIKLNDLNANSISSIEVLKSKSYLMIYGGEAARPGIVLFVITTKRGGDKDFMDVPPAPGTIKYTFNGFYKVREFYSPKYDNPKSNTTIPDLRSTIYWNPNLVTDKDGKVSFEYFNADTKGTYRIVVEGIDGDGDLGRQVYRYSVE